MVLESKEQKQGWLRSFGRTASRMSIEEQQALDKRLLPYTLVAPLVAHEAFTQKGALTVELGVGKGEQILHRAETHPEDRFIACEVFKNGLRSLVSKIEKQKLENIKLYPDDARVLVKLLPENSVDRLIVLYPDPWPKTKHKKRRIINKDFLDEAARIVKPDGELLLVTDVVDYAMWILREVYDQGAFFPIAINPQQWATPPQGWATTGYERKAKKEGRFPFYFVLNHKDNLPQQNHNKGETTE